MLPEIKRIQYGIVSIYDPLNRSDLTTRSEYSLLPKPREQIKTIKAMLIMSHYEETRKSFHTVFVMAVWCLPIDIRHKRFYTQVRRLNMYNMGKRELGIE
jgi:hypothetical protein